MIKRKRIRERGKFSFTSFFQKFNEGEPVALVRELSQQSPGFPKRMQGRTGKVLVKKGNAYVVEVNDHNMKKQFVVRPVHLKRIINK